MTTQLSFLESPDDLRDAATQEVTRLCKEVVDECTKELIDMALGRVEVDRDRRIALMNVIELAVGTKFRRGRPTSTTTKSNEIGYKELLQSFSEE